MGYRGNTSRVTSLDLEVGFGVDAGPSRAFLAGITKAIAVDEPSSRTFVITGIVIFIACKRGARELSLHGP